MDITRSFSQSTCVCCYI